MFVTDGKNIKKYSEENETAYRLVQCISCVTAWFEHPGIDLHT